MTPPAVLLTTVFTLSGMARANELIACYSIGVGLRRILALVLAVVFIVCCLILVAEDRILPPVYRTRTTYYWREMENKQNFFLDIKRDKIWYRSKDMIYNLQRFDPVDNTIHGMSVYAFDDDFNLIEEIDAERARYTTHGWELMKGTVTLFPRDHAFPLTKRFDEKSLSIEETPKDFQEIDKEVDGLRMKELKEYIKRMNDAGADTKSYAVKYFSRISLSFIPLVMCILGVPFSTRSRREGGTAKDLSLCMVITFFYWLFYSVGLSLGTNGALPPWLAAWLPSIFFAAIAATLIARHRA